MALMAMLFWGISYVWMKIVFEFYPPITIMFLRLSISSALMFGLFRSQRQKIAARITRLFCCFHSFLHFVISWAKVYGLLHVSPQWPR
jgi:drug/metabolite transporter (DMT)-like permease